MTSFKDHFGRRLQVNLNPATIKRVELSTGLTLARRCGWDIREHQLRRVGRGVLCEARECDFWRWWCGLHYKERGAVVRLTREAGRTVAGDVRRALSKGKNDRVVELLGDGDAVKR